MEVHASSPVAYDVTDDVAVVTLDDGKANALSHEMIEGLIDCFRSAATTSKALVLSGRPGLFCAGLDLRVIRDGDAKSRADLMAHAVELYMTMSSHPTPIVAACTGHAIAGGAMLLLCADIRIGAYGDYTIGLTEVALGIAMPRFGFTLAERRLDRRYLLRATVLAERFDPDGAVASGFLDRLADDPSALSRIVAAELSELDPAALRASRERVFAPLHHEDVA
jgi:enoyl-CoA hydratase